MYALVNETLSHLHKLKVNLSNQTNLWLFSNLTETGSAWSQGLFFEGQCFTMVQISKFLLP